MNQLLRNNNVTVTLQWPREAGAIYHVNITPETPHTELNDHHNTVEMNLTISYDILHIINITSSLCGVTTTKSLKFGKYEKYEGIKNFRGL